MIGGITGSQVAKVPGHIVWVSRSQRTQPHRGEQALPDGLEHVAPMLFSEHREAQRDRLGHDLAEDEWLDELVRVTSKDTYTLAFRLVAANAA